MKKCAFAIISVVMLAVMLSCEHKELYNGIPHVVNLIGRRLLMPIRHLCRSICFLSEAAR